MNCPNCQRAIDDGTQFCPNCGTPLTARPPSPVMSTQTATVVQARTSGFAIASLVCGILLLFSPLGIIFGIVALVQIGNNQGPLRGRGLAIAGLAVSVVVPFLILPAILFPVFAKQRDIAQQTGCLANQRQIALAIAMYAMDNNEQLPSSLQNVDIANPKILSCPTVRGTQDVSYGYNRKLKGVALGKIYDPSIVVLTADGGDAEQFLNNEGDIDRRRHGGRNIALASYVDGHVGSLNEGDTPLLSPTP